MKLDTTPWARIALDDSETDEIRHADPKDAQMHVGRGPTHWRASVTWRGHILADVRRENIHEAVREALDAV